ncbi:MAG: hypothetical protein PHP23_15375, partial [Desulfobacterales bacterium]|nr:hypothetical protein [Desulfobacterales bacterium]
TGSIQLMQTLTLSLFSKVLQALIFYTCLFKHCILNLQRLAVPGSTTSVTFWKHADYHVSSVHHMARIKGYQIKWI